MMGLRSADLIPAPALPVMHETSGLLTIVAMAALGLTVDIRSVMKSGGRVIVAALLSLTALGVASYALIRFLGVA
ncbi:hypothetical protein A33O_11427 [Nitratireductor aquibiodomus RA22]|uniref:Sulfate exporter family transporter n=2 Tax=Nitratireductor TaxID=245876 RepID=I5BXW8_9HYPH|nr:putative sulfate exporter family transporter [Nitratireductor aquibiodomus]EIM74420.1 hypothetical protein A33O_11427 [Nitratireductor aquibiodomus RA22]